MERREFLTTSAATAAGMAAGAVSSAQAAEGQQHAIQPKNPYSGKPGGGITLPPYYRPTPSVESANNYFPRGEQLGPNEMRMSFIGSTPIPVTKSQAGTCILVELGNGKRFFFDFGSGCMRIITPCRFLCRW